MRCVCGGGSCWWGALGGAGHLEGDLGGVSGEGALSEDAHRREAQTGIPPLTDGAGPPAVAVGKDT